MLVRTVSPKPGEINPCGVNIASTPATHISGIASVYGAGESDGTYLEIREFSLHMPQTLLGAENTQEFDVRG